MRIARRQRIIRGLIVVNLLTIWIPFASILMGILGFPFIYRLGKALRLGVTWLFIVAAFVPIIDLIGLLILNGIATMTLKRHQIRVGWTGARKEDLAAISMSA